MRMPRSPKPFAYNLLFLLIIALPASILVGALIVAIGPPKWMPTIQSISAADAATGFLFWYLMLLPPVLLGGLLHQGLLAFLADRAHGSLRAVALFSAPVILVGFLPFRPPFSSALIIPIVAGLMLYGSMVRWK